MADTAPTYIAQIVERLSGQAWGADTCQDIADILRAAGFEILDLDDAEEDDQDDAPHVIHTACRHCGQDIEGAPGEPEWRDRGNNSTCPNAAGDAGQRHEPIREGH
jgi:hypothetical protein